MSDFPSHPIKAGSDCFYLGNFWNIQTKGKDDRAKGKNTLKIMLTRGEHKCKQYFKDAELQPPVGEQETSCSAQRVRSQVSYSRGDNTVNKHLGPQLFFKIMIRWYFLNTSKIKPVKHRAALRRWLSCNPGSPADHYICLSSQVYFTHLKEDWKLLPHSCYISSVPS